MNIRNLTACLLVTIILCEYQSIYGYDILQIRPISRGGRWRIDKTAPPDFRDDQMNCGGYSVKYISNVFDYPWKKIQNQ